MNNWLNLLGLLFDIVGVIGLYFTKIKGLNQLNVTSYTRPPLNSKVESGLHATVGRLIYEMNKNIEQVNKKNTISDRKAIKYFWLIIIGFIFQISSSIFSLCHSPSDKPGNNTERSQSGN